MSVGGGGGGKGGTAIIQDCTGVMYYTTQKIQELCVASFCVSVGKWWK